MNVSGVFGLIKLSATDQNMGKEDHFVTDFQLTQEVCKAAARSYYGATALNTATFVGSFEKLNKTTKPFLICVKTDGVIFFVWLKLATCPYKGGTYQI